MWWGPSWELSLLWGPRGGAAVGLTGSAHYPSRWPAPAGVASWSHRPTHVPTVAVLPLGEDTAGPRGTSTGQAAGCGSGRGVVNPGAGDGPAGRDLRECPPPPTARPSRTAGLAAGCGLRFASCHRFHSDAWHLPHM